MLKTFELRKDKECFGDAQIDAGVDEVVVWVVS